MNRTRRTHVVPILLLSMSLASVPALAEEDPAEKPRGEDKSRENLGAPRDLALLPGPPPAFRCRGLRSLLILRGHGSPQQ